MVSLSTRRPRGCVSRLSIEKLSMFPRPYSQCNVDLGLGSGLPVLAAQGRKSDCAADFYR